VRRAGERERERGEELASSGGCVRDDTGGTPCLHVLESSIPTAASNDRAYCEVQCCHSSKVYLLTNGLPLWPCYVDTV
jgi:hypothetical protein